MPLKDRSNSPYWLFFGSKKLFCLLSCRFGLNSDVENIHNHSWQTWICSIWKGTNVGKMGYGKFFLLHYLNKITIIYNKKNSKCFHKILSNYLIIFEKNYYFLICRVKIPFIDKPRPPSKIPPMLARDVKKRAVTYFPKKNTEI